MKLKILRKVLATAAASPSSPFNDASTLGSILLRMQKITKDQLYQAVGVQARTNEHLLGALLIEQGAVSQLDVAKALEIQHKIRTGERADAEMTMLETALSEAEALSAEVSAALSPKAKARSGMFLVPYPRSS